MRSAAPWAVRLPVTARRFGIAAGVVAAVAVLPAATPAPQQAAAPVAAAEDSTRIAFAGTGHTSLGVLEPGAAATTPLFGDGPAHFDKDVSARGGVAVFVSLRDEPTPQVYLRDTDGAVRRLTVGRDAGHPELSPDLRWVVFEERTDGQRDLWAVRTDAAETRQLTATPQDDTSPTWSPTGDRIAFSRDGQIATVAATGGAATVITAETGPAITPAWNPVDPTEIAYVLAPGGNRLPGDEQLRITRGEPVGTPVLGGLAADWQGREPTWDPDGTALYFLSHDQVCVCEDDIQRVYRVGTTTVPTVLLPTLLLTEDRRVDSPAVLGDRIVVARTSGASVNAATLQDIRPDGSDPRDLGAPVLTEDPGAAADSTLLFDPGLGFDPWTQRQSYSPDGRRIAVSRFETIGGVRSQRIWLLDADGGNAAPMPVADRLVGDWETDAAWSPDGTVMAIARRSPGAPNREGGPSRIILVRVETGEVIGRLRNPDPTLDEDDTQPAWSPDGAVLAFSRGTVAGGPDGEPRDQHIWTTRAATLDQQVDVTRTVCAGACAVTDDSPAFTPDGTSIAFNREGDGLLRYRFADRACEVLLPTTDASCAGPVTAPAGPFQPRDVSFSPSGDQVVLTTRRAADFNAPEQLAVLDIPTRTVTPITGALPGRQKEPSWQVEVDLAVNAPPSTARVQVGQQTTVPVTAVNLGPGASPGTTVTVSVPSGLRLTALRPDRGACELRTLTCDLGILDPGVSATVVAEVTGVAQGEQPLGFSVRGAVLDPRPGDNAAETVVPVDLVPPPTTTPPAPPPAPVPPPAGPAIRVDIAPTPSYVGGGTTVTYTLTNGSPALATGLRVAFGLPPGVPVVSLPQGCAPAECAVGDLAPGQRAVLRVVLAPAAALDTTVVATMTTTGTDADLADNSARARLLVLQPKIVAVPPIGKPGFVTSVRGTDFPPGAPVTLTWAPGITAAAAPTVPRPDGTFAGQLLILAKDQTGPRVITATGPGFGPVTTPFLVVAGTIGPPGLVARR